MKQEKIKLDDKTFKKILDLRKDLVKPRKDRYNLDEVLLKKHLKPLLKKHTLQSAYFKATLINSFYSTRMGAETLFKVAQEIANPKYKINEILDTQEKISDKQLDILNSFAKIEVSRGEKDYGPYSFLTKYLAIHARLLHRHSRFPIYDQLVSKCIINLANKKDIQEKTKTKPKITGNNLREYKTLYHIIHTIAKEMGQKDNLTAVDQVFWAIGKYLWGTKKKRTIKQFNRETREKTLIKNMKKALK